MTVTFTRWSAQPHGCILQTAFGRGRGFLEAWQAWRTDPERPALLHVVAIEPWPEPGSTWLDELPPELMPLGQQLARSAWGLTPGLHRLSFEEGRVLLSIHVALPDDALREMAFTADYVMLGPPGPEQPRDRDTVKAIARLCRRGTRLIADQPSSPSDATFERELVRCGFVLEPQRAGEPLHALYQPAWTPKGLRPEQRPLSGDCVVIGGGLAGASVAAALARRAWRVQVVDQATAPASGASALPAGMMVPHLSPDDSLLSRLSRSGVRVTLQHAQALLRPGEDWQGGGTLEHRIKPQARPLDAVGFAADWSRAASAQEKRQAWLPDDAHAVWHPCAAWIRPGALVQAWLAQPGVSWRGGQHIERIERIEGGWRLIDVDDRTVTEAPLVVLAAAVGSAALASQRLYLQPVRGQVSWAPHTPGLSLPRVPVNGNGHFLPAVPMAGGMAWMCGASYGRGDSATDERLGEHMANFGRLGTLLPLTASQLAPAFAAEAVRAWTGVRCASTDRRPLVGEIEPGLWVSTAMGSRGLTFAALCAELLVSRLHQEPLPLPLSLAAALDVRRQLHVQPCS